MSDIRKLFGLEYPLFQGGMAWVADYNIASAVSNAGGLGIIASGSAEPDFIKAQINSLREKTDKPFGVNVILVSPFVDEMIELLLEEKPDVITTGAGNPSKYIERLKEAGITVVPVVPSVAMAKRCEKSGADAVIAEGMEAGGHIGELTTMTLVPQVVDAVNIPVIAAGGIADKRGVNAAFALGAVGIQVGTAFLTAEETNIHENYKNAIIKATDTSTIVTGRSTGHPVRCLKNKLAREIIKAEKDDIDPIEFEEKMAGTLRKAVVEGDNDYGSLMSGQIAGLVNEIKPAKEIIKKLFEGINLDEQ